MLINCRLNHFCVKVLIDIQYLPSVAYFTALYGMDEIIFEKHEHYVKQTYRNRCYINTVHGSRALIVPLTSRHSGVLTRDVRIDYTQKWLNNHWRTITSAYGKAPFFEHYSEDLEQVLFRKYDFLYDLNFNLLTLCLSWLKWGVSVKETLSYKKEMQEDIYDLRSFITPKNPDNIKRLYMPKPYYQVFGNAFAENLSVVDLMFCNGPEAGRIIEASSVAR